MPTISCSSHMGPAGGTAPPPEATQAGRQADTGPTGAGAKQGSGGLLSVITAPDARCLCAVEPISNQQTSLATPQPPPPSRVCMALQSRVTQSVPVGEFGVARCTVSATWSMKVVRSLRTAVSMVAVVTTDTPPPAAGAGRSSARGDAATASAALLLPAGPPVAVLLAAAAAAAAAGDVAVAVPSDCCWLSIASLVARGDGAADAAAEAAAAAAVDPDAPVEKGPCGRAGGAAGGGGPARICCCCCCCGCCCCCCCCDGC